MGRAATVDEYISALPEGLRYVAGRVREVVDTSLEGGESAIKWAQPVWSIGKEPVCYLKAASNHVTFGFWKGASIDDPSKRLETSGSVMAHVKLRSLDDIDEPLFARWLVEARDLTGPSA